MPKDQQVPPSANRIAVIINPAAGLPRPVLSVLNQVFQQAGVEWEVFVTKKAGDATRYAEQALKQGVDVVAAYGGDGTLLEVGQTLLGTNTPLGILPGGTGNALALELGIPLDLEWATRLLVHLRPTIHQIDVGIADLGMIQRPFFLRAAVGLIAQIGEGTDQSLKNRFGKMAYPLTLWQWLNRQEVAHYRLVLDGREQLVEGVSCLVLNAGGFGIPGLTLSRYANMEDGRLDVLVVTHANIPAVFDFLAQTIGETDSVGEVLHWQAREVYIESTPRQPTTLDGESAGKTPIRISVLPQRLGVLCEPTTGTPRFYSEDNSTQIENEGESQDPQ